VQQRLMPPSARHAPPIRAPHVPQPQTPPDSPCDHLHALLLAVNHEIEGAEGLQAALVVVVAAEAGQQAVGVRLGVLGQGILRLGRLLAHGLHKVAKRLADCGGGGGQAAAAGEVNRRCASGGLAPCAALAHSASIALASADKGPPRSREMARRRVSYSPEGKRRPFDRRH